MKPPLASVHGRVTVLRTRRSREPDQAAGRSSPERDLVGRGIAQWRSERPDIDSSGKAVVGRLLRLEEVILRTINEALAPHGIKYQAYAVLATLRVAGAPYRLTPSRLQATLLFSSGGLSNLLKRLERDGLVNRAVNPQDGRGVIVSLTAKGRGLADRAMPDHAGAELKLLAMFSPREREVLSGLLSRMMVGNAPDLGSPRLGCAPEPSLGYLPPRKSRRQA
jgi:DNA-binding MarR family transcriptional regulator